MNTSGINPKGDRVLVQVEEIERRTAGGIELPESVIREHETAQMAGILVDIGADAWSDYVAPFAGVGERVMFARHGGIKLNGSDGLRYRIMNDVDITATLDAGTELHEFVFPEKRLPLGAA